MRCLVTASRFAASYEADSTIDGLSDDLRMRKERPFVCKRRGESLARQSKAVCIIQRCL